MGKLVLVTDLTGKQMIGEVETGKDFIPLEDSGGFVEIKNPMLFIEGPAQVLAMHEPAIREKFKNPTDPAFLFNPPSKYIYLDSLNIKLNSYKFVDDESYFKLQDNYKEMLKLYMGFKDKILERVEEEGGGSIDEV